MVRQAGSRSSQVRSGQGSQRNGPMLREEMSQPPTTRSLGCTMGRREEKGTKTLFPNRSFPSRTVEACARTSERTDGRPVRYLRGRGAGKETHPPTHLRDGAEVVGLVRALLGPPRQSVLVGQDAWCGSGRGEGSLSAIIFHPSSPTGCPNQPPRESHRPWWWCRCCRPSPRA